MAVTENPLIIMMINMTVVFLVLISLIFVIKFIHFIDPTKPKETPAAVEAEDDEPLVAVKSSAAVAEPEPVVEEGVTPEIIAAISAAVAAYGFAGQVRAVKIINHEGTPWRSSARFSNLPRK